MVAVIRPAGKPPGTWALPKGRIAVGESPEETALREVQEETGARGRHVERLGDVRYWFNWKEERVFKVVTFFLLRYEDGRLGDLAEEFRREVAEVRWLPLSEAPAAMAHKGDREMVELATVALTNQDV
jgi:8-oxo-dGTP pyrophosphatase MutT (NUDIX family)